MTHPRALSVEDIDANIREIVRLDRQRQGRPVEETVISRPMTDVERAALAGRDTRRPMERLLAQPLARPARNQTALVNSYAAEPCDVPIATRHPRPSSQAKPGLSVISANGRTGKESDGAPPITGEVGSR